MDIFSVQSIYTVTLWTEATFSLCELLCKKQPLLTTIQIRPIMWMDKLKKMGFFPVLDWFRALCESCVSNQNCRNFFIPVKLAPFDNRPDN